MSSFTLPYLSTVGFLKDRGFRVNRLSTNSVLLAAMRKYWAGFSVCYVMDTDGRCDSFWWDRQDGWLPVSLLPR